MGQRKNPQVLEFSMKKPLKILIIVLLILALLVGTVWFFFFHQNNLTADFYADWAASCVEHGHYKLAVWLYQRAWSVSDENPEIAISLADAYAGTGNYTKAEYTLVRAIADRPEALDLYLALSHTYVAQDKLLDASRMLDNVANESARQQLEELRPAPPEMSPEAGYYHEYISVSLSYADGGTAYLTCDGEFPTTSREPYAEPVALEPGETTAIAVVLGENGLVSSAVQSGYTIGGVVEPVTLQDSTLDSYVRELLGKDAGSTIMSNELWDITELTVPSGITTTADLSNFIGLTSLTMQSYHGNDFAFLESMQNLTTLDLSSGTVTTQSAELLGDLPKLETLNLSGCGISNLSGLSGHTALVHLDLSGNSVADLSPLAGCSALKELNLSENAVTSLAALGSLTALETLDLSYNAVTGLDALAKCANLTTLNLSHCSLTSLAGVGSCTKLQTLTASANQLQSISGLEACTDLQTLDVSDNQLTAVNELAGLDSLVELNINYNDVTAAPAFGSGSKLERFYADHNFMADLSGLSNLEWLNYVTLDYNNISSIDALAGCYNLVQVNVFGTNIHDASAVKTLTDRGIIVNYTPTT